MQTFNVLLIDDDREYCENFKTVSAGYFNLDVAFTGQDGINKLKQNPPDIIFLDYYLKRKETGLDVLRKIRNIDGNIPVIMISEHTSVEIAVEAMKLGAYHYTSKYGSVKELLALVEQELHRAKEKLLWQRQLQERYDPLLGESPAMKELKRQIQVIAATGSTVLITGETGVGKELIAWEIHKQSRRYKKPFVTINTCALPDSLFESELFGHTRGAFTGATENYVGKFELANTGTIFLDEIGTIPNHLQAKLLRVLDANIIQKIGSERDVAIDVRIIAATNLPLRKAIQQGVFREDLFYRLSVLTIQVPPLRERKEDIPLLADYHYKKLCAKNKKEIRKLSETAIKLLREYDWPGNVRELVNVLENYSIFENDELLRNFDRRSDGKLAKSTFSSTLLDLPYKHARECVLQEFQNFFFRKIMERFDGNLAKAADYMGVTRTTIYRALNIGKRVKRKE